MKKSSTRVLSGGKKRYRMQRRTLRGMVMEMTMWGIGDLKGGRGEA